MAGKEVAFQAGTGPTGGNLILRAGAGTSGGSGSIALRVKSGTGVADTDAITINKDGAITFNTAGNDFTFPTARGTAAQVLTDVAGDGNLSWSDIGTLTMGSFNQLTDAVSTSDSAYLPRTTAAPAGVNNTAIGFENLGGAAAGSSLTTGTGNTLYGTSSGQAIANGDSNTCIGALSGSAITSGNTNTLVGHAAGSALTEATSNTCIGADSGKVLTASETTLVGTEAGMAITTGTRHTVLGATAGNNLITGDNCTIIGYGASASSDSASNEVTLGNAFVETLRCADTTIASLSDRRDKTEIVDSPYGLEFINRIRPAQYKWQTREGSSKDGKTRLGFIAQEFLEAMPNGENEILDLVYEVSEERLEAKYGNLIPIMAKAIQELSAKVAALEAAAAQA